MLLAIDVGNSNIVLGCFWDGKLKKTWRVSTHPISTSDEFRLKLQSLFHFDGIEFKAFNAVIVSSVVPQMTSILRTAFPNTAFYNIDHSWPFSFQIKATPAEQVGADRLVNAEAAVQQYGAPCILIDSGTATTICAVSRNKEYLGGAIMPGVELSLETLARKTAKLFTVELAPPPSVIGTNTQLAIRSGILNGYAAMLDGMVDRFKQELKEESVNIIATGGMTGLVKNLMKTPVKYDPDLTLKGIQYLYESISAK